MKKLYYLFASLFFFFTFLCSQQAYASHMAGMELTYECLGGDSFRVNLNFIRACEPTTEANNIRPFFLITMESANAGTDFTQQIFRDTNFFEDITPLCLGATSRCSDDSSNIDGYSKYLYTGVIQLPSQETDWRIMVCENARNNSISTVNGGGGFYSLCTYAQINNTGACNNSPVFKNDPVFAVCAGTELCIDNSVIEADGDSIVYEIHTPYSRSPMGFNPTQHYQQKHLFSNLFPVNWLSCAAEEKPFCSGDSIAINQDGIYCVNPGMQEVTIVSVLVKEYRAGQLVGSIIRDMQIKSFICSNPPPELDDLADSLGGNTIDTTVCPGVAMNFNIDAVDPSNQIVQVDLLSSNLPAAASINILNDSTTNPTVQFSWTPTFDDTSDVPYCFILNAFDKDAGCDFVAGTSKEYCFTIDYDDQDAVITSVADVCENAPAFNLQASPKLGDFQWSGLGITDSIAGTFDPSLTGPGATSVEFSYVFGFCSDTTSLSIQVDSIPEVTMFRDTTICDGTTILLGGSPTAQGSGALTYTWTPAIDISSTSNANPTVHPSSDLVYYLNVSTPSTGCQTTDSVQVFVNPNSINVDAGGGASNALCTSGGAIELGGAPTATGVSPSVTYTWTPAALLNNANVANPIANVTVTTTFYLTVSDTGGCFKQDTVTVTVTNDAPTAFAADGTDTLCTGGSIILGGNPSAAGNFGPFTYNWMPATELSDATTSNPVATPSTSRWYELIVGDANGCTSRDSVFVQYIPGEPTAEAGFGSDTLCTGQNIELGGNPTAQGSFDPFTYQWFPSNFLSSDTVSNPIASPVSSGYYVVQVTDDNGCVDLDSVYLRKVTGPIAKAAAQDTLCTGRNIQLGGNPTASLGQPNYTYEWQPSLNMANNTVEAPIVTVLANTLFTVKVTDDQGCSDLDSVFVIKGNGPLADASSAANDSLCTGGQIELGGNPSASLGVSPLTYAWYPDNGDIFDANLPNPIVSPSSDKTYFLLVTDSIGCSDLDWVFVRKTAIQALASDAPNDTLCSGGFVTLGATPISVSNNIGAVDFLWTPSASLNNPLISNPISTTTTPELYVLKVTDNEGCSDLDSVFVNTIGLIVDAGGGANDSICSGGTVRLGGSPTVSGGSAPYNFAWSPSTDLSNSAVPNPFSFANTASTYILTVTDQQGCSNTDTVVVHPSISPINADAGGVSDSLCTGGDIFLGGNINALGGNNASYTFEWSPAIHLDSTNIYNPLYSNNSITPQTNTYQLIVTDADGCLDYDSVTVEYDPNGVMANASDAANDSLCTGENIVLGTTNTAQGGMAPYSYLWSPPASLNDYTIANPIATPNAPGEYYTLQVSDADGCSDVDFVYVRKATGPLADATNAPNDTLCTGGSVELGADPTAIGGVGAIIYEWTPSLPLNNAFLSNPIASVNTSGWFTVKVTDADGCSDIDSAYVDLRSEPIAEAGFGNDTLCTGGSIELGGNPTATGSLSPFSYSWTPNASINNDTIANPVVYPATSSWYVVEIQDADGCYDIDSVFVDRSSGIMATAGFGDDTLCTGGDIQLGGNPSAQGGVGAYSYLWMPNQNITDHMVANPVVSPPADRLYVLKVTDSEGCSDLDSVFVRKAISPVAQAAFKDTVCTGGTIQLGANPSAIGTGPFSYAWMPTNFLSDATVSNPFASPASDQLYILIVRDSSNNCTDRDSVFVQRVTGPVATAAQSTNVCSGGTKILGGTPTADLGVQPYEYLWIPSVGLSNDTVANPITTITSNQLYTLFVTDANGCVDVDSVNVTYDQIIVDAGGDTLCNGGSLLLGGDTVAQGGTSPYTYTWTPNLGLSADDVSNPFTFSNVPITYVVMIEDANGCTNYDTVHVTPSVTPINADATPFGENPVCTGGTVILAGDQTNLGGTAPYTFEWTPSTYLNSDTIYNAVYNNNGPVATSTDYVLIVADAEGCLDYDSVTVNYDPNGPKAEAGFGQDTLCSGGSILIGGNPTGQDGLQPYTYNWFPNQFVNNDTIANPIVSPPNSQYYALVLTDANGCIDVDSVYIDRNSTLTADAGGDTLCTGGTRFIGGSPTAQGGNAPYDYQWAPNQSINTATSANPAVFPVSSQYYVLTVTDASGCQDVDSTFVLVNTGPNAEASEGSDSLCTGGDIILGGNPTASAGATPYSYDWTNGQFLDDSTIANPIASNLFDTTTFQLIVTDAVNCVDVDSVTVFYSFKAPIAEAGFGDDTICSGGTVQLGGDPTVNFGTAPFDYVWTPSTDLTATNVANPFSTTQDTVTYQLYVEDANGCSDIDFVTVAFDKFGPKAEAGFGEDTICSGGTVVIGGNPTAIDGTPPYTYNWVPDYQLQDADDANPVTTTSIDTIYTVFIEDAQGCRDVDSVFINYTEDGPWAEAGGENDSICAAGTIVLGGNPSADGLNGPFTYEWIPDLNISSASIANPIAQPQNDMYYVLFVEDVIGCKDLDTIFVDFREFPIAEAGFGFDTLCILEEQVLGGDPTAEGGVAPITYNWVPGIGLDDSTLANPTTSIAVDTTYTVFVTDADGCIDLDSVFVEHVALDVAFTPIVTDQIVPAEVLFENNSVGADFYEWNFGDFSPFSAESDPVHLYQVGGELTVELVGFTDESLLCSDTFAFTIILYEPSAVNIPNVFTPNNDDYNDLFLIKEVGMDEYKCQIYNRWGTELYSFDELSNSWDGRNYSGIEVPEGTYYYIFTGTGKDNKEYLLKGYFQLFR